MLHDGPEHKTLATEIGKKLFPATEAGVIADIVRRDLPYYDAAIPQDSIHRMVRFSQQAGILKRTPTYEEIVATGFKTLWQL